ncbi:MAG: hypothetical protein WBO49_03850 [Candidatus Saccharimonas sp.]
MKKLPKKYIVIGSIVAGIILVFVLLTTVGKPLFSKNITATKLADFRSVCYGDKIVNASAYTSNQSAVIAAFYEKPYGNDNPWTAVSGSTDDHYAQYSEFTKANVVACFEYQPFAGKQVATCDDLKLKSAYYKTFFYEAKTGKKLAEGKEIVNDSATCPRYAVYDKLTKETAGVPGTAEMTTAIKTFVAQ